MSSAQSDFKIDFIGIGAAKSATTWLYECLKEHPEICLSKIKDVSFFSQKENYEQGIGWYESYFSHCRKNQVKGEFTTSYLNNVDASKLIKQTFPNVKIIACLRNPIEKSYSSFYHRLFDSKHCFKSFDEALREEPENFTRPGFYYQSLKRYFDIFDKENILILIYEDINKNPINFIKNIYQFLEVAPSFVSPKAKSKINPTKIKISSLNKILHQKIIKRIKKTNFGKKLSQSAKVRNIFYKLVEAPLSRVKSPLPEMSSRVRQYLQKAYEKDVKNLEKLIGRNLDFWQ